ncbi:DMT family transporter [Shewanella glacialipiscicola]|uniref:Multidrug DMT transporter n=1 Tax=Shewanella glacialipiscicola TaxID=614069 RepID=A0ABQ6J184_9GAMM|nr:DMT family transporter [Shewanella glacialipiscicola]MCL1087000.1 DMT family transporter [Shewanella glacialipiscicola]GIU17890.1 multidrug DMT transporter [Shewanella glacialipiscicola]GMA80989.1 multidrug DMT transporter [Shewanella glacialipiscicola]
MLYLFPLLAVFIWAGNSIVNKLSFGMIEPEAIAFYRWFFAMLILTPFVIKPVWKKRHIIQPLLPKFATLALLGMVLNQSLAYFAAATTTATNMALITSLVPMISLFLAVPLLKQKLSPLALIGMIISLFGLIFMLSQGDIVNFSVGVTQGDILLLISAFMYALYGVLIKRWQLPLATWESVYIQGVIAVVLLLPLLFSGSSMAITTQSAPLVMYAAIAASLLAPWAWINGINRLGADSASVFFNLMPIVAAVLAAIILDETLAIYHYIGGSMVIMGVMLVQIKFKPKVAPTLACPD